jgi:hypothetical protein
LGLLWAKSRYGPVMKVVHFVVPYNSCLRTLIIGEWIREYLDSKLTLSMINLNFGVYYN